MLMMHLMKKKKVKISHTDAKLSQV